MIMTIPPVSGIWSDEQLWENYLSSPSLTEFLHPEHKTGKLSTARGWTAGTREKKAGFERVATYWDLGSTLRTNDGVAEQSS